MASVRACFLIALCSVTPTPRHSNPGPEVVAEAVRVLEAISAASGDIEIKLEEHQFGGCAIDAVGEPLTATALKACQEADAILLGAQRSHPLPLCVPRPRLTAVPQALLVGPNGALT